MPLGGASVLPRIQPSLAGCGVVCLWSTGSEQGSGGSSTWAEHASERWRPSHQCRHSFVSLMFVVVVLLAWTGMSTVSRIRLGCRGFCESEVLENTQLLSALSSHVVGEVCVLLFASAFLAEDKCGVAVETRVLLRKVIRAHKLLGGPRDVNPEMGPEGKKFVQVWPVGVRRPFSERDGIVENWVISETARAGLG